MEKIHLGEQPWRIPEAEAVGVRSVPTIVLDGRVFHINYGASLEQLKEPYKSVVGYPGHFTSCCQP